MTPTDKQIREALDAFKYCIDTIRSPHYPADENAIWSSGSSSNPRITEAYMSTAVTVLQSALDKGGDALKLVHTVYAVEDDFTHIFSTEQLAKDFADKKELPCVISTYLIDHPERFYEAVQ